MTEEEFGNWESASEAEEIESSCYPGSNCSHVLSSWETGRPGIGKPRVGGYHWSSFCRHFCVWKASQSDHKERVRGEGRMKLHNSITESKGKQIQFFLLLFPFIFIFSVLGSNPIVFEGYLSAEDWGVSYQTVLRGTMQCWELKPT